MICPATFPTFLAAPFIIMAAGIAIALILATIGWTEYLDDLGTARRLDALKDHR